MGRGIIMDQAYGPLGRERHHTDDFFDHRKAVLDRIRLAMAEEKRRKRK